MEREVEYVGAALYLEVDAGALGAAQHLDDFGIGHLAAGYHCIVGRDDAVAGAHSDALRGAAGRGLYHIEGVLDHVELYADAAELAFERLIELAGLVGSGVCRVGVEGLEHGDYGLGYDRVGVDLLHIVILDEGGGQAELLVGSELTLALGGGGESGHQQRGGGQYGKCDFFHSFGMKGVMSTP